MSKMSPARTADMKKPPLDVPTLKWLRELMMRQRVRFGLHSFSPAHTYEGAGALLNRLIAKEEKRKATK